MPDHTQGEVTADKYRIELRDPFGQNIAAFEYYSFTPEDPMMNWYASILKNDRAVAVFSNTNGDQRAPMYVLLTKVIPE
jgi:hypothetical protein